MGGRTIIAAALLALGAAPQAVQPLRLHPANPHYFEFRGQPAVLVTSGEHYGAVMNLDFDYGPYLDTLQAAGHNLTRTFSGVYCEGWGFPWNTLNPAPNRFVAPWARSGTAGYADGGNKFDLNQWDAAYFARLKDFVAKAGQRGVVVELVLFCAYYDVNQWNLSPLKSTNNVNGVGNIAWDQVLNLSNAAVTARQDAMVQKIVTELNAYDNVYYEICNEPYFGNATQAWHQHIADTIWNTESGLPNRHLIAHNIANGSTTVTNPISAVSIFNFHYSSPPNSVAQNYGLNKVVAFDETGFRGSADLPYRKEAWDFLVAGGAVYSNLDWSYTDYSEAGTSNDWDKNLGGGGATIRAQLKILKSFMDGFAILDMAPNNGVIKGGLPAGVPARALVEVGQQYAIYLNGGSQANLVVELPAATYTAEWINTKSGATDKSETFTHGGGNRTLVSPGYSEDIALRITGNGVPPPPYTPPPPPAGSTFYRAVNLNGPALTIDGHAWEGATTGNYSFSGSSFENQGVALSPATDSSRATMIRSSVWNSAGSNVTLTSVPAGTYLVYLYVWEDNTSVTYDVSLEGAVVQSGYSSGAAGHWDRLGPWTVGVNDGTIQVQCSPGDANLSGIEVWSAGGGGPPPPPPPPGGSGTGLTGEYYDTMDFSGTPVFVTDAQINFDWGTGSPGHGIGADTFSVRWTGQVLAQASETYTFTTTSDDGVRLWVGGTLIIDNWTNHAPAENSASVVLVAGQAYDIVLEYYENGGGAVMRLDWSTPTIARQPIPTSQLIVVDSDGDGASDREETVLGTNPNDPGSVPGGGGGGGVPAGAPGGGSGGDEGCGLTGLEAALGLLLLGRRRRSWYHAARPGHETLHRASCRGGASGGKA